MNAGIAIANVTTAAEHEPPPADRLVEVLLPELVRTLTGSSEPGTVLGGRPHLRLFGEAIDLALPLRALRRRGEAACGWSLDVDEDTLAHHARALTAEDGYLLSSMGMGHDERVPADAMSLCLFESALGSPMNALLRADPARPESWLAVVAELRGAVQGQRVHAGRRRQRSSASRMARLHASLVELTRIDDPRLPRVLGELLVHALMAVRAVGRERPWVCDAGQAACLFRTCSLPTAALADLRWAASEGRGIWRDLGMLSASPHEAEARRLGRDQHPHLLEIRPRSSAGAGRWLGTRTPQVLFPPGTPFEVLEVVEAPHHEGGPPRLAARLIERSPRATGVASRPDEGW